jgi:hypothetical protein
MKEPRITIFAGPVGAGKTEISINYALKLKQFGTEVALIDYDVVKPYIRVRDAAGILSENGLTVLMPDGKVAFADMPIVPQKIYQWIADDSRHLVMDVGGDKQGSTALGQIMPRLSEDEYEFCLVINPYRPFTNSIAGIKRLAEEVSLGARTKFDSIVGNPHVKEMTTIKDFMDGLRLIREASAEMNLPIKFIGVSEGLYPQVKVDSVDEELLPMQMFVTYPWQDRCECVNWIYKG